MSTALKQKAEKKLECQWWLAEVDVHCNPTLIDGPHEDRFGVERALHIIQSLGLVRGRKFVCAQVVFTDVKPRSKGVSKSAIRTLNSIGLRPPA